MVHYWFYAASVTDTDPALDAEYRAFVRSMHKETIDTIIAAETWWQPDCFRLAAMGGYDADSPDGPDSEAVAQRLEEQWRAEINPRMLTLIYGHPDPDVRDAADFMAKRLFTMIVIIGRRRTKEREVGDETSVAIQLVHDGFTRLRRAAYHAPFRVHRPTPRFDGYSIGNNEPLPGKMLELIRQLQEAGALPEHDDRHIFGNPIPEAVKRLSDIFFLPDDERSALFQQYNVEDPVTAEPDPSEGPQGFGFAFQ